MRASILLPTVLAAALAGGCTSLPQADTTRAQAPVAETQRPDTNGKHKVDTKNAADQDSNEQDQCKAEKPPKTLFEWTIGPKVEKTDGEEEQDSIVTDRPDFTEASSTVGLGRVQLEAGYTYFRDRSGGSTQILQTYPEALLRVGLFADWFELRLGETYIHSRTTGFGQTTEHLSGLSDLYLGVKLALTEQKGHLPETGIILQSLLPTAGQTITANEALFGFNYLFGWDIVPKRLTAGGTLGVNSAVDDQGHSFVVINESFTIGYLFTEQFGAYTEWFALIPSSSISSDIGTEHYFNGGFSYKITPDFQVDIRAGFGLNKHAQDFFTGAGFAVRY
jgi:Putative MetA-pathway of phenol degradation